nr:RNA-directed DNA polymerase [Tanacetum cinerariifolium]
MSNATNIAANDNVHFLRQPFDANENRVRNQLPQLPNQHAGLACNQQIPGHVGYPTLPLGLPPSSLPMTSIPQHPSVAPLPPAGGALFGHSSRQHRRVRRSRHDFDFKFDIPKFDGKIQPDEFLDWLHTIQKVFDFKKVSEDRKMKIVSIKLQKHASLWWENLKMRRVCEGRKTIRTKEKMK